MDVFEDFTKEQILQNDGEAFTSLDELRWGTLDDERNYLINRKEFIILSELEPYEFRSKKDITDLIDILVADAKDAYIYPVTHVYDARKMIKYGLWPSILPRNESWVQDWIDGLDVKFINFWAARWTLEDILGHVDETLRWEYKTMETIKRDAIETANGMMLKLYAPELVYKISNRPKNDMSLFRNPSSNRTRRSEIVDDKVVLGEEEWYVIPVTRYAKGMKRGFF